MQNTASESIVNATLALTCDPSLYAIQTRSMRLPMLVPGVPYEFSTFVQVITDAPIASTVHVFVSHEHAPGTFTYQTCARSSLT